MSAIISLFIILTLSFLFTRLATLALALTGLSRDLARLQSVSAFTGVGFTTRESERIVDHPVRRRILMLLMIVGNAGIVTAIASLILSFAGVERTGEGVVRALWLLGGIGLLWLASATRWVTFGMDRLIRWALARWTRLRPIDFAELLNLSGPYLVRELTVEPEDWVAGRRLEDLELFAEGITVLGIHREDGEYVGVPRGETLVEARDCLVLYGRREALLDLDDRRKGRGGDEAHARGEREQSQERANQRRQQEQRQREEQGQ